MKKIGILTYQNTINFGAALQMYALHEVLKEKGCEVEIINYINETINKRNFKFLKVKRIDKKIINYLQYKLFFRKKINSFNKFDKRLNFSKKFNYSSIRSDVPKYDYYLIGSDQLWNHDINLGDDTYFGEFVKDKTKLSSYATSFGLTEVDERFLEMYRENLNNIENLSVREKTGAKIIEGLLKKKVKVMPDPVILYTKLDWKNLAKTGFEKEQRKKFYVTYFLNHNTYQNFSKHKNIDGIRKLCQTKLSGSIKLQDFISSNVSVNFKRGPVEFLQNISNAEFVFTDSFHATLLSIILNKNFVVFLSGKKGRDSRILDLLTSLGLKYRIYNGESDSLLTDIEYSNVNEKLMDMRKKGLDYLTSIFG